MNANGVIRVLTRLEWLYANLTAAARTEFLADLQAARDMPDFGSYNREWVRAMIARIPVPPAETGQNRTTVRAQIAAESALIADSNYNLERTR